MFIGDVCGKAEEAIRFYKSIFPGSEVDDVFRYSRGEEPDKEGTIEFAAFRLNDRQFGAMDSARGYNFGESFQPVPPQKGCGRLKDKYGLS